MTARQLIRKLEALDKKYPRRQVVVDVGHFDPERSHQIIDRVDEETVNRLDDDGGVAENAKGEELLFHTIALKIY